MSDVDDDSTAAGDLRAELRAWTARRSRSGRTWSTSCERELLGPIHGPEEVLPFSPRSQYLVGRSRR